jgi:CheY-like chemotaxis protein
METAMDVRIETMGPQRPEDSRLSREHGHEFANIFSIIIANAEMIGEDPEGIAQVRRRLERIITASRRGEGLVHRIRNSEDPEKMTEEKIAGASPGPVKPSGRVLVVDDEVDVVEIIRRYLLKEGLQVQGVTDSVLALDMLRADPFAYDLVITDLDMPQLTGTELCGKLYEIRPDLPVIMATGYERHVSETPTSASGVKELLLKPLNRDKLLAAIRRLLTP